MATKNLDINETEPKFVDKLEVQTRSAIVIQRNFRSFLWRKFFRNLSIELKYSLLISFQSRSILNILNSHHIFVEAKKTKMLK